MQRGTTSGIIICAMERRYTAMYTDRVIEKYRQYAAQACRARMPISLMGCVAKDCRFYGRGKVQSDYKRNDGL
jgi:hypothetical protein